MDNLNLGGGSDLLDGGNQAINDALARRQTGQAGQLQAQSPASAGFDPSIITPTLPNPNATPASTVSGGMAPSPSATLGMGNPTIDAQNELILKALATQLRNNSQLQKAQAGVR